MRPDVINVASGLASTHSIKSSFYGPGYQDEGALLIRNAGGALNDPIKKKKGKEKGSRRRPRQSSTGSAKSFHRGGGFSLINEPLDSGTPWSCRPADYHADWRFRR